MIPFQFWTLFPIPQDISKLENLGPFAFSWSLSSGEVRWEENFRSVLTLEGKTISYEVNGENTEAYKYHPRSEL